MIWKSPSRINLEECSGFENRDHGPADLIDDSFKTTPMRYKLVVLNLYVIAMTPLLLAGSYSSENPTNPPRIASDQSDCDRDKADDATARFIKLDLNGTRGVVSFRHKTHEAYANPDTAFAHQAEKGAECVSCHHARSEARGTPLLWKCAGCHLGAGDPKNPRNRDSDEVSSERAFHELCIGCHRASNDKGVSKCKAPVACSECHASTL